MHKPELYIKESILARDHATYVMNRNLKLLEASDNYSVLDVGCGPGNVTYEQILPILPNTTKKLVGIDISLENVEYGRRHYQGDSRVSYQQMDITTDEIPNEYVSAFDLVISLNCLHYVKDHKKALSNIHKMMKPEGKTLISFLRKSPLSDVYCALYQNPKWTKYMSNIDQVASPQNSVEYYVDLFKEIGYTQIKHEDYKLDSFHSQKGASDMVSAVSSFKIPEYLETEFIQDHFNIYRQTGSTTTNNFGEEIFNVSCFSLIISGTKTLKN